MEEPNFISRPYGEKAGDFQLVEEWGKSHGSVHFVETLLPPVGLMVEDDQGPIAVAWLHLSAGIGVGIVEHLFTRPGLDFKRAGDAVGYLVGCLKEVARSHDYGVLMAFTHPGIARAAMQHGFVRGNTNLTQLFLRTD
jgi:hypothetical protein